MSVDTEISQTVSAGQLRAFIERIERIEEEIKAANGDKSEIYKEARGCGFDVKAIRQCVAARKLDSAEREERDAIFDLYWSALNGPSRVHVHAQENIEQFGAAKPVTDTQEQPETAQEKPASGLSAAHADDAKSDSDRNPVDEALVTAGETAHSGIAQGRGEGRTLPVQVSNPAPATNPHSPAVLPGKADKTSEAALSSTASLAPPAGTKHADTNFGSDPLNDAPSADADQAGAIVGHPMSAVAPAALSAMNAKTKGDVIRLLRPFCQYADDLGKCGGQSSRHCNDCEKLKRTAAIREDA